MTRSPCRLQRRHEGASARRAEVDGFDVPLECDLDRGGGGERGGAAVSKQEIYERFRPVRRDGSAVDNHLLLFYPDGAFSYHRAPDPRNEEGEP